MSADITNQSHSMMELVPLLQMKPRKWHDTKHTVIARMYLLINLFTLIRGIPLCLEYKDQIQWCFNALSPHKKAKTFQTSCNMYGTIGRFWSKRIPSLCVSEDWSSTHPIGCTCYPLLTITTYLTKAGYVSICNPVHLQLFKQTRVWNKMSFKK